MFLIEIHGMCKYCPMLVFYILLWNVYNFLEQCKTFFVNFHVHPSPCCPFSCFVNLLFPFCSPCFNFSKFLKGSSKVGSLGYSKDFVVISHILFNMLEINVDSIIVSKVFGVTIIINFYFFIVKYMCSNCKLMVVVEKMELVSLGGDGGKNVVFLFKWHE